MRPRHKKYSNYIVIAELKSSDGNDFTNPIYIVRKRDSRFDAENNPLPKYQYDWFMKKEPDTKQAQREVVAQEFFRLINQAQPKTRFVKGSSKNGGYIISKGINGFTSVASMDKTEFKSALATGKLRGLGELLTLSLVTNEVDLHLHNLGSDRLGNLIKIDGGCCFEKLKGKKVTNYSITEKDISQLPNVATYAPINWLDLIKQGKSNSTSEIVSPELATNSLFRNEVNCALLKILVLPNSLINSFTERYTESSMDARIIATEINSRRNELKKAALENESFQKFLQEPATLKYLENYINELKQFKTMRKDVLVLEEKQESVISEIQANFKQLSQPLENKVAPTSSEPIPTEKLKSQSEIVIAGLKRASAKMRATLDTIAEVSEPKKSVNLEMKNHSILRDPLPTIQNQRPEKGKLVAKSRKLDIGTIIEETDKVKKESSDDSPEHITVRPQISVRKS